MNRNLYHFESNPFYATDRCISLFPRNVGFVSMRSPICMQVNEVLRVNRAVDNLRTIAQAVLPRTGRG